MRTRKTTAANEQMTNINIGRDIKILSYLFWEWKWMRPNSEKKKMAMWESGEKVCASQIGAKNKFQTYIIYCSAKFFIFVNVQKWISIIFEREFGERNKIEFVEQFYFVRLHFAIWIFSILLVVVWQIWRTGLRVRRNRDEAKYSKFNKIEETEWVQNDVWLHEIDVNLLVRSWTSIYSVEQERFLFRRQYIFPLDWIQFQSIK